MIRAAVLGFALIAGAVIILAGLLVPPRPRETYYGVSVHQLSSKEANQMSLMGMDYIRSDVGGSNWQRIVTVSQEYHLSVIGIIDYFQFNNQPLTMATWNHTVTSDVHDYPTVHTWEIWNEPDLSGNGYPTISPAFYFKMLESAYEIVKNFNAGDIVLALGGYNTPYTPWQATWLSSLSSLGFQNYCDAVSIHLYSPSNISAVYLSQYQTTISAIKEISSKPVWVTETGTGARNQASYIPQVYGLLVRNGITHIVWYNLKGNSTYWYYQANYGLLYSDGTPTPGYYAMQRFIKEDR